MTKYFYAGGCARYMFSFDTEEVKDSIMRAVKSFSLKHGPVTDLSLLELTNRLFSSFAGQRTDIVSEYARLEIQATLNCEWLSTIAHTPGLTSSFSGIVRQAYRERQ